MPSSSDPSSLENKLDLLIGLLRIAHSVPLKTEREAILAEPVSKAILAAAGDWIEAGKLKSTVVKKAKVSNPTVSRRLAELLARGILTRSGSGPNIRYRSTGLFEA
jgi:hypothetical protein